MCASVPFRALCPHSQQIADLVYSGRDDVLMLENRSGRLAALVEVEAVEPDGDAFPHLYGPLNRDAVVGSYRLLVRADGRLDTGAALR